MTNKLKVAIVHYWLDNYRGGEKVVEALCELYPEADIYTHIYKPENLPKSITGHKVFTTFISKLPFAEKYYRHYLPLMPIALLCLNLKKYNLIISSESGPAKGIRKSSDALHICYCHSPMRYIWDMESQYISGIGGRVSWVILRGLWKITACYMRIWDRWSSKKVDYFIANSKFISARIRKFYGQNSEVIPPPVEIHKFKNKQTRQNFYLCASQLVSYKKVELVVDAFNKLSLPLVIIGEGSDFVKIKAIAKDNVTLLGKVSDDILKDNFERCKAFVYAGKEDFGIVFAEALSAGSPIIAYGKGGVRDIVIKDKTGIFFYKQNVDSICRAVEDFESGNLNLLSSAEIVDSARKFSKDLFKDRIKSFIIAHKRRSAV